MARKPDRVISLSEAARRLGISYATASKRVERGTLPAVKRSGRWYISLDNLDIETDTGSTETHDTIDTSVGVNHDTDSTEHDSSTTALLASKDELIATIRDERDFLRRQVEQERQDRVAERERFDIIHREALQRIEALSPGPSQMDHETHQDDSGAMETFNLPTAPGLVGFFVTCTQGLLVLRRLSPRATEAVLWVLTTLVIGLVVASYLGTALSSAGHFFSWENAGRAAIISTIVAVPLAIIGIVVSVLVTRRSRAVS